MFEYIEKNLLEVLEDAQSCLTPTQVQRAHLQANVFALLKGLSASALNPMQHFQADLQAILAQAEQLVKAMRHKTVCSTATVPRSKRCCSASNLTSLPSYLMPAQSSTALTTLFVAGAALRLPAREGSGMVS